MKEQINIIDTNDYSGKQVIFTCKKWKQKFLTHPELLNKTFLKNLKNAIEKPDEIWEDYSDKRKRCYYKRYSTNSYVKVVIWVKSNPCQVVSAFEIDYIKEAKYPKLKNIL